MTEFLRRCEITIGPLADQQGGGNVRNALLIVADGTQQRLRAAFSASKTLTGEPNKTEVLVYNLSRETRQAIRGNLARVRVTAGYSSDPASMALVASGALLSAVHYREGPDIVTHMTVLDGYGGLVYGVFSNSYAGGTPLNTIVRDVAQSMPGVEVGQVELPGVVPSKGVALAGAPNAQLNKLGDQHGFSWSVQNGVFQAIDDRRDTGRMHSFDSDYNLMSCMPLLNGPLQMQAGVEIQAKFDARVKPGDRMRIRSTIAPNLSGEYKVTSVNLSFDSHGPALLRAQSQAVFTI